MKLQDWNILQKKYAKHISSKGLISGIYKEFSKLKQLKKIQLENEQNTKTGISPWNVANRQKHVEHHWPSGKCKLKHMSYHYTPISMVKIKKILATPNAGKEAEI